MTLGLHHRVPARRAIVGHDDVVRRRAPQEARAPDGRLAAAGCLEPRNNFRLFIHERQFTSATRNAQRESITKARSSRRKEAQFRFDE